MNRIIQRAGKFIVSIGPAFFVVGYTIGTGSVVTMASAGSRYGMEMLWVLVLACLFSFFLLEAYGRFALVTGKGSIYGMRRHLRGGRIVSLITLIGLVFVEILALTGIMGVVADLLNSWSKILFNGQGWNIVMIDVLISLAIYLLILFGKYSVFEKVLIFFVSIMALSFLLTLFIVPPPAEEVIHGLFPSIPNKANAPMILAAIVGTTFTAPTFVVRSILMKEKRWDSTRIKHARGDAFTGSFLMFLISVAVMASAAATLYTAGKPVDKVVTMIQLLEPLLGKFAISVFVSGILGAALSSIIPIVMLAPLLISDYRNKPVDYKSPSFRLMTGAAILFGLVVPVFHFRPVFVMLVSQAFQVFLLPLVVVAIFVLINRHSLMGQMKAGWFLNIMMIIIFFFTLLISWQAVVGIMESFHTIF